MRINDVMSDSNIKREKTGKKGKRTGGGGDARRRDRRGSRQGDRSGGRRGDVEAGAAASPRGNACCRECIFICIFILLNDTYCISRRRGTWDRRDRAREGSYKRTFLLNTFFFRIRHAEVVRRVVEGDGDGGSEEQFAEVLHVFSRLSIYIYIYILALVRRIYYVRGYSPYTLD